MNWHAPHPANIQQGLDPSLAPPPPAAGFQRCVHVGRALSKTRCRSCRGVAFIETNYCQLHGVPCVAHTRAPIAPTILFCRKCDDRKLPDH